MESSLGTRRLERVQLFPKFPGYVGIVSESACLGIEPERIKVGYVKPFHL